MDKQLGTIDPNDVLEKMSNEEFIKFSKMGYNYVMFEAPKNTVLRKGSVICMNGEYCKTSSSLNDIVEAFKNLSTDDLKYLLMNEFAKIGVTITFLSLGEKNILSKIDAQGNPVSKNKLHKELHKEVRVMNNTAVILRKMVLDNYKDLGVDPTSMQDPRKAE
jgi:hypothetical protein